MISVNFLKHSQQWLDLLLSESSLLYFFFLLIVLRMLQMIGMRSANLVSIATCIVMQ